MDIRLHDPNGNTLSWSPNPSLRKSIWEPEEKTCEAFNHSPKLTSQLIQNHVHDILAIVSASLDAAMTKTEATGVNHLADLQCRLERLQLVASDVKFEPPNSIPLHYERPLQRLPPGT